MFHKVEYLWIDGSNFNLRSKIKVFSSNADLTHFDQLPQIHNIWNEKYWPIWSYDGSSTGQAVTQSSEVFLKPVRVYLHPYFEDGYVLLCETYETIEKPHNSNMRHQLDKFYDENTYNIFNKYVNKDEIFRFGFEPEFFMRNGENDKVLGFPPIGYAKPQGDYYCGNGINNIKARKFMEDVLERGLNMGLGLVGYNMEVAPGQGEFQVTGYDIKVIDDLVMLRYLLGRVGEYYDIYIDWAPKPLVGDWNGSGMHINFSDPLIRKKCNEDTIKGIALELEKTHKEYVENSGTDNTLRLTGKHETSSSEIFTYGTADRSCSMRVPRQTVQNGYGYLEDRRPGSNCDPYVMCRYLITAMLNA